MTDASKNKYLQILFILFSVSFTFGIFNSLYFSYLYSIDPRFYWLTDAIQFCVVPVLAVWVIAANKDLVDVGFRVNEYGNPKKLEFWVLFLWLLLAFFVYIFTESFFGTVSKTFDFWLPYGGHVSPVSFSQLFYLSITAALAEEIYYRGVLYRLLLTYKVRDVTYILISSILFSLVHWEQGLGGFAGALCLGVVYAYVYVKTKTLIPLIVNHFIIDMILIR